MIEGHGDDSYRYARPIVSDFSSNVYGQIDLQPLKEHLCRRMELIGHYPEPEPYTLETRLACQMQLPAGSVCVTNGATEAIYLIAQTFRGTRSAILQPTFSEYEDACRLHDHRVSSLYTLPDERTRFRLPPEVRMCWLCNPNNPTGGFIPESLMQRLIEANPEVCFVIDHSYAHFVLQPLCSERWLVQQPHVLVLHSLTKQYAVPGLRLGYITGQAGLLQRIRANRMPWSVNQLAVEAGLYLMDHDLSASVDMVAYLSEARRLRRRLEALGGLEVWESQTHFMLVRLRMGRASALKEYLANEHGILIRDASNFNGLDERYFRLATQTPAENDRLVEAIAQWFAL